MLVLSRKIEEAIVIDSQIVITVLEIDGTRVKLGIKAPRSVSVLRQEIFNALQKALEENQDSPDTRTVQSKVCGTCGCASSVPASPA